MCAGCGAPPVSIDWFQAGVEDSAPGRIRGRMQLAQAASSVLRDTGLRVSYYPGASTLAVYDSTGATVTVRQLSEIWPAVHKLADSFMDPLDTETIVRQAGRVRDHD